MKLKTILMATAAVAIASPAAAEGTLNIYNWSDYIAEDTIQKFEEKTGIKVTYDVFDSNEVLEAKLLAGSSGYDLVVPSASFMARQIQAGVFQKLDKSKLPNIKNLDSAIMGNVAEFDPGNEHGVVYMWGTTGIGYNEEKIAERLGDSAPTDSWALVFDEGNAAKLADCGISMLDAPTEIIPAAMNYLGLDPKSKNAEDFKKAADLLAKVKPHVRYFHSSQYINDLANGDVCVSVGWSGDIFQARDRADEAENGNTISYVIPKEGALSWFDMMVIPADAANVENAHKFLDFLMDAQITADITNYVWYASANIPALELIEQEILDDPGIFPPDDVKEKLWVAPVYEARADRAINREWTRVKTGQ
ncbi:MAG: polyamine ABC transporter substrate-binding protein [Rhizobiaceae bacterium]|nr:polyamine ABC transporter substrate-binding protein [Rhizobiaceae bacterium]